MSMIDKSAKDVATDGREAQAGRDGPETDFNIIVSSSAGSKSLCDSDCNTIAKYLKEMIMAISPSMALPWTVETDTWVQRES